MKQIVKTTAVAVMAVACLSSPLLAEGDVTQPSDNPELSEGAELLNRGFQLLLEGLANEVEPMADKWAEGWAELIERFSDMNAYYPPETLPNGDIIIKRRIPLAPDDAPLGETDL